MSLCVRQKRERSGIVSSNCAVVTPGSFAFQTLFHAPHVPHTFIPSVPWQCAVVLALLIKNDYPEVWTDAFDELQSLLGVRRDTQVGGGGGSLAHVDLYLRVLCALDEEVVCFHVDRSKEEAEHNSVIKV